MKASHAMVYYAIFVVVVLAVASGFVFRREPFKSISAYISPQEARSLMARNPEVVVIDVSPFFYDDGHLPGALNYPRCTISDAIMSFGRDKAYLVYCHGFGSPMGSVHKLKDAGFTHVYALLGNYGAWADAGFSVEN